MIIKDAQYIKIINSDKIGSIQATIDGKEMGVPICVGNRHYDEIMKQVKEGTLTIKDAD